MSSFTLYGLDLHEVMSPGSVFKETGVSPIGPVTAERPVAEGINPPPDARGSAGRFSEDAYRIVEALSARGEALRAGQVMRSPVVAIDIEATVEEALRQFRTHSFRHMPVVSRARGLVGIISDRDLLHYVAGLTKDFQQQEAGASRSGIAHAMTPRVLTAGPDTDLRYIARLFVERRIGAMPVVGGGALLGMITRSDVLGEIVRRYALEWWA